MEKKINLIIYVILAFIIGIVVGMIDTVFGKGLILIGQIRNKYFWYLIPFLPIVGIMIVYLYHRFSKISLQGMTLIFETGQQKREAIPLALIPLVMICTWMTHLFGGSAGREGVAVQIGATLSHYFSKHFHFPKNGKVLLITGMAAGFAGLFQTPLAALFSIGASLGIVLGILFHLPLELCAALGYIAVFASATNTLIAPIMIGLEVFGSTNMYLFILVCIFAYLLNGNKSIYGAQMNLLD